MNMKKFALIVLVIVVVGFGILLAIPYMVDVNDYKDTVESKLDESLNMRSELGTMELSVFPWVSFDISDARFYFPESEKTTGSFKHLKVTPRLIPLLRGNISIRELSLIDPEMDLNRFIAGKDSGEAATTKSGSGEFDPYAVSLSNFSIKNGILRYGQRDFKDVDLSLYDFSPGEESNISLSLTETSTGGRLNIEGTFGPLDEGQPVEVPLDLNFASGDTGLKLSGLIENYSENPEFDLDIDMPLSSADSLEKILSAFQISPAENITGELGLDLNLKGTSGDPVITGIMKGENLVMESGMFGAPVEGSSVELEFTGKGFESRDLNLKLGKNSFKGELNLSGFDSPDVRFDFSSTDRLDLLNLIESLSPSESETSGTGTSSGGEEDYPLTAKGDFSADEAGYKNIELSDVNLHFLLEDGVAKIKPVTFNFYDGNQKGRGSVDLKRQKSKFDFDTDIKKVKMNPFLSDATTYDDTLFGNFFSSFSLNGRGFETKDFENNLKGSGEFHINDGKVTGFSIIKAVNTVAALTDIDTVSEDETKFEVLRGNPGIRNGHYFLENLEMISSRFDMRGEGKMSFGGKIDFRSRVILSKKLTRELGDSDTAKFFRNDNGRAVIPLKMSGNVADPSFSLDEDLLQDKLEEKAKDKVKDEAKDKAKDLLNDVF